MRYQSTQTAAYSWYLMKITRRASPRPAPPAAATPTYSSHMRLEGRKVSAQTAPLPNKCIFLPTNLDSYNNNCPATIRQLPPLVQGSKPCKRHSPASQPGSPRARSLGEGMIPTPTCASTNSRLTRKGSSFKTSFLSFFIFGYTGSSLLCGLFSSYGKRGLLSSCGARASHYGGFSCCGAQAQELWHTCLVVLQYVGSSQTRDQTHISCIGRQILYH